jgi:hypothetical protein
MSNYAKRVDDNQKQIVECLRRAGFTVEHLHTQGGGCPDLLCGISGQNFLIEIKDGKKKTAKLNELQENWHSTWKGQVSVIKTIDECLDFINKAKGLDYE